MKPLKLGDPALPTILHAVESYQLASKGASQAPAGEADLTSGVTADAVDLAQLGDELTKIALLVGIRPDALTGLKTAQEALQALGRERSNHNIEALYQEVFGKSPGLVTSDDIYRTKKEIESLDEPERSAQLTRLALIVDFGAFREVRFATCIEDLFSADYLVAASGLTQESLLEARSLAINDALGRIDRIHERLDPEAISDRLSTRVADLILRLGKSWGTPPLKGPTERVKTLLAQVLVRFPDQSEDLDQDIRNVLVEPFADRFGLEMAELDVEVQGLRAKEAESTVMQALADRDIHVAAGAMAPTRVFEEAVPGDFLRQNWGGVMEQLLASESTERSPTLLDTDDFKDAVRLADFAWGPSACEEKLSAMRRLAEHAGVALEDGLAGLAMRNPPPDDSTVESELERLPTLFRWLSDTAASLRAQADDTGALPVDWLDDTNAVCSLNAQYAFAAAAEREADAFALVPLITDAHLPQLQDLIEGLAKRMDYDPDSAVQDLERLERLVRRIPESQVLKDALFRLRLSHAAAVGQDSSPAEPRELPDRGGMEEHELLGRLVAERIRLRALPSSEFSEETGEIDKELDRVLDHMLRLYGEVLFPGLATSWELSGDNVRSTVLSKLESTGLSEQIQASLRDRMILTLRDLARLSPDEKLPEEGTTIQASASDDIRVAFDRGGFELLKGDRALAPLVDLAAQAVFNATRDDRLDEYHYEHALQLVDALHQVDGPSIGALQTRTKISLRGRKDVARILREVRDAAHDRGDKLTAAYAAGIESRLPFGNVDQWELQAVILETARHIASMARDGDEALGLEAGQPTTATAALYRAIRTVDEALGRKKPTVEINRPGVLTPTGRGTGDDIVLT